MERSIPAARSLVERLDRTASAHSRPVGRLLARQILDGEQATLDILE
jgi:hypothetical protein